jgi:hypothetical protein
MIQEYFPDLMDQARVRLNEIGDLFHLSQPGLNISNARTLEEAREALEDGGMCRYIVINYDPKGKDHSST